ncbi:hypothetical protein BDZ94DRAFT_1243171 [Collybia nuda]|uniref:Uncharacterized protein n=1 Tax=Collybia nuda TaxID=64659 RepID=A0A9P6CQ08_9AGAR|nr:hypothetical protein BDZ94DRAFT_1243171 [Collybia nuda]
MDEADEKALLEQQRKEIEKLEERRRAERLRACERIWEQEKRKLREAKALALRRKAEEERRRSEEAALIRRTKEKEEAERRARLGRPLITPPTRNVVSYDTLGQSRMGSSHATLPSSSSTATSSSRVEEPFVYDFMVTPRRTVARSRPEPQSLSQLNVLTVTRPSYDESRCVPFSDVLASMQGPLFPLERHDPGSTRSQSKSSTRRTSELLDCLLKVVEWAEGERKQRKGKAVDRQQRRGSDKSVLQSHCVACSSPVSPVSTSSSWLSSPTSSRRSWLSFGSTSSSISTTITTPSTSPIPTWLSKPLSASPLPLTRPTTRPRPMSLLLPPISLAPPKPHSCKPYAQLTPIPIEEAPLSIPGTGKRSLNSLSPNMSWSRPAGSHRKERSTTPPGERVMRRVSQFVELAKGFQNAYMSAALFSASASSDPFEDRDIHTTFIVSVSEGWHVRNRGSQMATQRLNPTGSRAHPIDVSVFLSPTRSHTPESSPQFLLAPPIPLRPRCNPSANPPRTVLPNPLPYPIIFKPLPVPCRSPFRLHAHIHLTHNMPTHGYNPTPAPWVSDRQSGRGDHGSTVTWRVRTVENPAFLRLKALHNIMWDRGTNWQGRAREGSLGAGKEKILKIAFEGVGRSWLGIDDWQVASHW